MTLEQRVAILEAEVARLKQAQADPLSGNCYVTPYNATTVPCPSCGIIQYRTGLCSLCQDHAYDSVQVQK